MAMTPATLHEIATQLRDCICGALEDVAAQQEGIKGCPCRACVVPGAVAWDSCDDPCGEDVDGGQLAVSLSQVYASTATTFPAEDRQTRDLRECAIPVMAAEYVISLTRCAPIPSEDGCPPSCEELEASARQLHSDAFAILQATLCCTPRTSQAHRGRRFVMGRQRVLGPEGGCVGVEQRVTVELPGCPPCDLVGVV